jgi:hypothetical protein
MIPQFPEFKKIELSDEEDVKKFTSPYPPYSDFNFTSIWSWDTDGEMRFSKLNENLVVRFMDYMTRKPFLSFIGKNKIDETAAALIAFSKANYNTDSLKFIPGEIASLLNEAGFQVLPDADATDYIYQVDQLSTMHDWKGHQLSKNIRKFLALHPDYVVKISPLDTLNVDEYLEIFEKWAKSKSIKNHPESNEYMAFKRFLDIKKKSIKVVSLYKDHHLIGFTAYEILSEEYAIAHFSKADTKHHSAIYDILNWEEAKALCDEKVIYYNWEQDLGIQGLQDSKLKYKPCFFLSKFIIKDIL